MLGVRRFWLICEVCSFWNFCACLSKTILLAANNNGSRANHLGPWWRVWIKMKKFTKQLALLTAHIPKNFRHISKITISGNKKVSGNELW